MANLKVSRLFVYDLFRRWLLLQPDPIKTTKTGVNTFLSTMTYAVPLSTIQDGQVQAPTSISYSTTVSTSLSTWTSVMPVHTVEAKLFQRQDDRIDEDTDDDDDDDDARYFVRVSRFLDFNWTPLISSSQGILH